MRKKKIILLALLTASLSVCAQNRIKYAYDEAGNRVKREIVITRGTLVPRKDTERDESYYDAIGDRIVKLHSNHNGVIKLSVLHMLPTDEGGIVVYSIKGMEVLNQPLSDTETVVDISDKPTGIYILRVTVNGIHTTWKITKK